VKWTKTQTSKKEGKESKNPDITGSMRGVKERKIMAKFLDVGTRREKTGFGWKERKEGREYAMRREKQLSTCGMDVGLRERNGEKQNEDGREIRWMKKIWKRRERIEKERGGG
jgi:hypothetical protein